MAVAAIKSDFSIQQTKVTKASLFSSSGDDFSKHLDGAVAKSAKPQADDQTKDASDAQDQTQDLPSKASDAPDVKGKSQQKNSGARDDSSEAASDQTDPAAKTKTKAAVQPTAPQLPTVTQGDAAEKTPPEKNSTTKTNSDGQPSQVAIDPAIVVQVKPEQPSSPSPGDPTTVESATDVPAKVAPAKPNPIPPPNVAAVNIPQQAVTQKVDGKAANVKQTSDAQTAQRDVKVATKTDQSKGDHSPNTNGVSDNSPNSAPSDQTQIAKNTKPQVALTKNLDQPGVQTSASPQAPDDQSESSKPISADVPKIDFDQLLQANLSTQPAQSSAHSTAATSSAPTTPQNLNIEQRFIESNHPQIISDVRGQLMPHGGTLQIRLDPPELGALNVTMKIADGTVTASFQTANPEATRLLSHSLNDLKNGLESAGVSVDKLHVSQVSHDQMSSNDFDQRNSNTGQQATQQQQDQQRREMMRRLWRKISGGDPVDLVA